MFGMGTGISSSPWPPGKLVVVSTLEFGIWNLESFETPNSKLQTAHSGSLEAHPSLKGRERELDCKPSAN